MPTTKEVAQEKLNVLAARGDGNCALRSIIQSLLAQGMLHDKKEWVAHFIQELVKRNEGKVKEAYNLDKPTTLDSFIQQYEILQINQLDRFSQDFFINKDANTPTPSSLSLKEQNRLSLLLGKDESTQSPSEANELAALFVKISSSNPAPNAPKDDSVLYFLNACLRRDIISFNNAITNKETTESREYLATQTLLKIASGDYLTEVSELDQFVDIQYITPYLKHHNIDVRVYNNEGRLTPASTDTAAESNNEVSIHLIFHDRHYNVLLPAKELQIKQDESMAIEVQTEEKKMFEEILQIEEADATYAKDLQMKENEMPEEKLQIEKDEEMSKKLQIKEIENYSKRFEASSNKDNRSFINDVINGLGLEKELNTEQLSHLRALQNSTTLEKLVESLQDIIAKLGYSSQFKEQIQNHSFFSTSTCRQEVANTSQMLTPPTPTIKI